MSSADHISKTKMQALLQSQYSSERLHSEFEHCCKEHEKCSGDLAKIAHGIEDLARLKPTQYIRRVSDMENALESKCHQLKEQRGMIHQLLTQSAAVTRDNGTQMQLITKNSETQIYIENSNFS
jgi:hypothetical protein